jgi:hypothetical protein
VIGGGKVPRRVIVVCWAAAGFKHTLLMWKLRPEVRYGTRRQFSRGFKLEAVRLVKDRGVSVAQAG